MILQAAGGPWPVVWPISCSMHMISRPIGRKIDVLARRAWHLQLLSPTNTGHIHSMFAAAACCTLIAFLEPDLSLIRLPCCCFSCACLHAYSFGTCEPACVHFVLMTKRSSTDLHMLLQICERSIALLPRECQVFDESCQHVLCSRRVPSCWQRYDDIVNVW